MALRLSTLFVTFVFAAAAMGADSEERTHPLDDVPACMQPGESAAADSCVLKGSGDSQQMNPPGIGDTNVPAIAVSHDSFGITKM